MSKAPQNETSDPISANHAVCKPPYGNVCEVLAAAPITSAKNPNCF